VPSPAPPQKVQVEGEGGGKEIDSIALPSRNNDGGSMEEYESGALQYLVVHGSGS